MTCPCPVRLQIAGVRRLRRATGAEPAPICFTLQCVPFFHETVSLTSTCTFAIRTPHGLLQTRRGRSCKERGCTTKGDGDAGRAAAPTAANTCGVHAPVSGPWTTAQVISDLRTYPPPPPLAEAPLCLSTGTRSDRRFSDHSFYSQKLNRT